MEILNLKLYDDPLNLSNFLVTHSNVRYVNLSIFADMEVSSKWASRNTRLHVERMLKLYDTDPEDIIVKLPNNGAKEITAIRFDWFVYIMIAVPDVRLKWTTARKQWVKHWCGECVPIPNCPWSMNEPDPDISLLATSTPAHCLKFIGALGLENIPQGTRVSLLKAVSFIYNSLLQTFCKSVILSTNFEIGTTSNKQRYRPT